MKFILKGKAFKQVMAEKKLPKDTTIKKWKESFSWLRIIETKKLVCVICSSKEEKIKLMPRVNLTLVTGGTNYKLSALQDHHLSEGHKRAVKEEEAEKARAAGLSIPPVRVVQNVPENSAISKGFKQIGETERAAISKLHDIAYYIDFHIYIDFWYNAKPRRLNQYKRKLYKKRESNKKQRVSFDVNE